MVFSLSLQMQCRKKKIQTIIFTRFKSGELKHMNLTDTLSVALLSFLCCLNKVSDWIHRKSQNGLALTPSSTCSVSPGQVISALRETGVLNNTVVIFTADHGELAMEHRQFYKMSMFEGSSHVPLLIMGPGLISGQQVNQLVSLVDLYPTVLGKEADRQHRMLWIICLMSPSP